MRRALLPAASPSLDLGSNLASDLASTSAQSARRSKVRIYVYDLPPKYNVHLAAHFKFSSSGRWDDSWLYGLDILIHRWLLHSPYRTLDPKEADFFFVPCYISLGFYDFEFGLYWLSGRGFNFVREAFDYVQATWPHWNQSKGADHLFVMTNDKGGTFARAAVKALEKSTILSQWGWRRPHIFRPDQDVVLPPILKVSSLLDASPFLGDDTSASTLDAAAATSAASGAAQQQLLLSFIGSIRPKNRGYSFGVRQKIFKLYNSTPGFLLRDLRGESVQGVHRRMEQPEFLDILHRSKFCLAPAGMGFSTRVYESIAQGCVPLIIQHEPDSDTEADQAFQPLAPHPHSHPNPHPHPHPNPNPNPTPTPNQADQAFEDLLPYANFSLRLKQDAIPNLPKLLADFPREHWLALRRNLGCVWPRIMWLREESARSHLVRGQPKGGTHQGSRGGAGSKAGLEQYDAWETMMATLARKAARRRGEAPPPFRWQAETGALDSNGHSCGKV